VVKNQCKESGLEDAIVAQRIGKLVDSEIRK
jgi:hypothetical protein